MSDHIAITCRSTTVTFHAAGPFNAFAEAKAYCKERGLSVGTMQGDAPIGLKYGDYAIAKWRNLSDNEKQALDGTITGNKRNGPVVVHHN